MRKKLSDAITNLVFNEPFYASLLLRMRIVEDDTCPTGYTDGVVIGYNPSFVDGLNPAEIRGFLIHEIMHVVHFHHLRANDRDQEKWNYACDYAINSIIVNHHYTLPPRCLLDPSYANMTPEQIYPMLPDNPGGSGSGIDPNAVLVGEVRPYPSNSKQEVQKHESELAVSIRTAAMIAKKAGKLPGGMEDLITGLFKEKIDWKAKLIRFVNEFKKDTYKWTRPNRRLSWSGVIIPSLSESPTIKSVVVMFDTSGSMTQRDINIVASEVSGILSTWKEAEIRLLFVDTVVQGEQLFKFGDDVKKMNIKGRGGTSYIPGFNYLSEKGINPVAVVYFTDGYCNWFPKEKPDYPVLWLIVDKNNFEAPFGEVTYYDKSR